MSELVCLCTLRFISGFFPNSYRKKKPPGIDAFDANWRPPDDGAVTDQPRAQAGGGMGPSGNVISRYGTKTVV